MNSRHLLRPTIASVIISLFLLGGLRAAAHCDSVDGPVAKAAQQALAEGNVNLTLIWVQRADEMEIKQAFEKTITVRKLTPAARELADLYFMETLVRVHRAGEREPYTGLKPAGRDLGPAIPAGDKALEIGDIKPLRGLLSEELGRGLQDRFRAVMAKKNFDKNDVKAGREYVRAYTEFIHYVEAAHDAAAGAQPHAEPAVASGGDRPSGAHEHVQ